VFWQASNSRLSDYVSNTSTITSLNHTPLPSNNISAKESSRSDWYPVDNTDISIITVAIGHQAGLPLGLAMVQNAAKLVKMIIKFTVAKGKSEISQFHSHFQ
jgi:hypothetical protein